MKIAVICNNRLALPALDYLIGSGMVVAVATSERFPEIGVIINQRCINANIPYTILRRRELEHSLFNWLNIHKPDVVLVKTFPYLIPASVLRVPDFGFINFHYAPLPQWRGANPLFWMIRNGETAGAVTAHLMNENFDEGPVIAKLDVPVKKDVNFGLLNTQLAYAAVQLTITVIDILNRGKLETTEQDSSLAGWYNHPKEQDLFIDWQNMDCEEILALVRACNPWMKGAATRLAGWTFGITYATPLETTFETPMPGGTIVSVDARNGLVIACKDQKSIFAEVIYCEEGFYPGYCLAAFGIKVNDRLS